MAKPVSSEDAQRLQEAMRRYKKATDEFMSAEESEHRAKCAEAYLDARRERKQVLIALGSYTASPPLAHHPA